MVRGVFLGGVVVVGFLVEGMMGGLGFFLVGSVVIVIDWNFF